MAARKAPLSDDHLIWIPLTPTVFFVLMALAEGPRHGYAIMKRSAELSEGKVRMGPGSLYTTIQRLSDAALIEEVDSAVGEDSRRRLYRLTAAGRSLLEFEVDRLESVVKTARRLNLRPLPR
jgi:DNA-binding PadR family transcriptional regulator